MKVRPRNSISYIYVPGQTHKKIMTYLKNPVHTVIKTLIMIIPYSDSECNHCNQNTGFGISRTHFC